MHTCKELIERIKDILSTEGLKTPKDIDVAREIKLHPNTLAQAKFQNRIPYPNIMDFLQRRQISINLFFYGQEPMVVAKESEKYKILKLYIANASAGGGSFNSELKSREIILDDFLAQYFNISKCEAFFVSGDSMEDLIKDGAMVLCNREEIRIKNGKIYAIWTLDGLFIKKCFIEKDCILLHSLNSVYTPLKYYLKDVLILGKINAVFNKI